MNDDMWGAFQTDKKGAVDGTTASESFAAQTGHTRQLGYVQVSRSDKSGTDPNSALLDYLATSQLLSGRTITL
ncbi:hypothetical protein [Qipengyuania sp. MTN3-11]|uniref:hypothetical protein n=1 Tax=Qipengyuania sp. MTN3-11 TaxID=3056557 RepID=UPI0036F1AF9A